jgi:hypothetical protein
MKNNFPSKRRKPVVHKLDVTSHKSWFISYIVNKALPDVPVSTEMHPVPIFMLYLLKNYFNFIIPFTL